MRKAMTLVGVLVALFISLIILSVALKFFVSEINFAKTRQGKIEDLNRVNLNLLTLKIDLRKAGYGFDIGKDRCGDYSEPLYWDSTNKTLSICFVDYDIPGCENKTFEDKSCSYRIEYKLENGQLKRCVDKGADGSISCHSLLGAQIAVSDFKFDRSNNLLTYEVDLKYRGKIIAYKDSCINLNLGK